MNYGLIKIIFLFTGLLMLVSCKEISTPKPQRVVSDKEVLENKRKAVRMESNQIDKYIDRRGWKMTKTASGLRYMVYDDLKGDVYPKENDTVYIKYVVSLIDGKTIYVSDSAGLASFVVGHDEVENGLQEGVQYLTKGDKAKFIVPSHLAHGYTGDFNRIPRNATVIFDISLVRIND